MKKIFALTFIAAMACFVNAETTGCPSGSNGPIVYSTDNGLCVATIYADAGASETVQLNDNNPTLLYKRKFEKNGAVTVDKVVYQRTDEDKANRKSVVFPFSVPEGCNDGKVFAFEQVRNFSGSWILSVVETSSIEANVPYIIQFGNKVSFKTSSDNSSCKYTIQAADSIKTVRVKAESLKGSWKMKGTYQEIVFDDVSKVGVYGFSGYAKKISETTSIEAGKFVKAGSGASVPPLRAYLVYNKNDTLFKASEGKPAPEGMASVASISDESLPSEIEVEFLDKDGNVTAIAQMNTRTGEISSDKNLWFDLKGRKLNKKPTVKGTYYNNGQKVIIK